MIRFVLRALIAALGLWVASRLGFVTIHGLEALLVAGALLGVVNAIVRPIVTLLTLPLTVLTLGLFLLVVNGLMLFVVSWLLKELHIHGFHVGRLFWNAIVTTIIVWAVSLVATMVLGDGKSKR
jgi:putative membrane protein